MAQIGMCLLLLASPVIVAKAWTWCARRYARDAHIDQLIALNRAKARPGMDVIDWMRANRSGESVWHEKLRAQRRWSQVVPPTIPRETDRIRRVN